MTLKDKILWTVAISGAVLLFVQRGCHQAEMDRKVKEVSTYSDSAQHFKNKYGVEVSTNQSLELKSKSQLESVVAKYGDTIRGMIKKFKSASSFTVVKTNIEIRHDTISMPVPIPCDFDPIKIRRDSTYYKFTGTIGKDYFSIDTLTIPNTQSIVIGLKRMGFLKRPQHRIDIMNSNPLIQTTNIGSNVVETPRKWHETRLFNTALGFVAGYYVAKKLN